MRWWRWLFGNKILFPQRFRGGLLFYRSLSAGGRGDGDAARQASELETPPADPRRGAPPAHPSSTGYGRRTPVTRRGVLLLTSFDFFLVGAVTDDAGDGPRILTDLDSLGFRV